MRTGVIAKKVGMTRLFQDDGRHVPVTVLALDNLQVVARREESRDGYTSRPARRRLGQGEEPRQAAARPFRQGRGRAQGARSSSSGSTRTRLLDVGAELTADHFVAGQLVDVQGVTQGKGFAGAMKRWGFGGLRATHGVSVSHRSHGSTGNRQDPGRVFKNKKMAGHMGARNRTQQNLEVVRTDADRGLHLRQGLGPRPQGRLAAGQGRGQGRPSRTTSPIPPASGNWRKAIEHEEAPAGMVEEAAVHEIPALPSDEEVAAIAAEQEAGAARRGRSRRPTKPPPRARLPAADESKEG